MGIIALLVSLLLVALIFALAVNAQRNHGPVPPEKEWWKQYGGPPPPPGSSHHHRRY